METSTSASVDLFERTMEEAQLKPKGKIQNKAFPYERALEKTFLPGSTKSNISHNRFDSRACWTWQMLATEGNGAQESPRG